MVLYLENLKDTAITVLVLINKLANNEFGNSSQS